MHACGYEAFEEEGPIISIPLEIFPTGKKTARHGLVIRRSPSGNRPLEPVAMEWGFPTKVASKRDPAVKLDKYVTNARNLGSSMWKPSISTWKTPVRPRKGYPLLASLQNGMRV